MKIVSIEVVPLDYALREPFEFAGVRLTALEYALVKIETDEGIVGFGECPVYWEPRNETQESTLKAIAEAKDILIGYAADDVQGRCRVFQEKIPNAFAAQCGLDMACYDIVGKAKKVPVAQLFGKPTAVPVEAVIPLNQIDKTDAIVKRALDKGIRIFKVKVNQQISRQKENLSCIRNLIGPSAVLFIDANQCWPNVEQAAASLQQVADIKIDWVEQPLTVAATAGDYIALKKAMPIPIMLDEAIYTADDLAEYSTTAIEMVNIKLAKSGGLSGAHELYKRATDYGKKCMLGSMIEGALGTYAGLQFASTHPMATTALAAYELIDDPLAFGPPVKNGIMELGQESGLGYPDEKIFFSRFV